MRILRISVSLFILFVSSSLFAKPPIVIAINLKLQNLPENAYVNTEIPLKLNQWVVLGSVFGEVASEYDKTTKTAKFPALGVVKKIDCNSRFLILWQLLKEHTNVLPFPKANTGILMNELLVLGHCKVLTDIAGQQPSKLGQAVHIKSKNIEVVTTLKPEFINDKPSGRLIT